MRVSGAIRLKTTLVLAWMAGRAMDASDVEFFESRIRPLLAEHCYECHSAASTKLKGGLRVDSREQLMRGGDTGPAIHPGQPEASLLLRAVSYDDPDLQMPPKTRLPESAVSDLRRWIQDGAVWPAGGDSPVATKKGAFDLQQRRAEHWAWKPIRRPELPAVRDLAWPAEDFDRFVLARLEAGGLRPALQADKRTLIRRATFAITGLPPSPGEIDAFLADDSSEAFPRVVDRLLASPRFGERWARHWLDKVRFAETMGHEFDYPILGAWRYRDYVIRALNADLPYDQFAREQVAGDLVRPPRRNPRDGSNESLLGTAQFWFCQQVHSPVDVRASQADLIDNQVDVISKAFLGLTVACARCHDHKFDAISTRDYYALYGVLSSSRHAIRAVDDPEPRLRQAARLIPLRDEVRRTLAASLLSLESQGELHPGRGPAAEPERSRASGDGESAPAVDRPTVPPGGAPVIPSAAGPVLLRPEDVALSREGWFADGEAFSADPSPSGQPAAPGAADGVTVIPPGWRHSASLARRFQGALRSPTFTVDRDFLHVQVAGKGTRMSLALEGFSLIRSPIYGGLRKAVQEEAPRWVTFEVSMWKGRRAWLEFADLSEGDPASELNADARTPEGWLAVGEVVSSALKEPPASIPGTLEKPAREVLGLWRDAPERLSLDEVAWINRLLSTVTVPSANAAIATWREEDGAIRPPILASVMTDGTGLDEPVFIRGNHRTPGEAVPRRFLEALRDPSDVAPFRSGSGRLALAEAITAGDNPLFARVAVNWVWSHLVGTGLSASVDNLGALGERPSHPELLDWLADEFRRGGWSIKGLIREIVLSRTWQMESHATDPGETSRDPENRLLHRANLVRLEGESIRDAMLAVSGRLDPTVGGPSIRVHLTPFMEGRGRPADNGPEDGQGRRSVYLEIRRNFLSPMMLAFDMPAPATTVGRRSVSNVPAQALTLMNDPFVAGQARYWAERLLREENMAAADRTRVMFEEALGRPPTPSESALVLALVDAQRAGEGADVLTAWASACHAVFNAKEFVFIE